MRADGDDAYANDIIVTPNDINLDSLHLGEVVLLVKSQRIMFSSGSCSRILRVATGSPVTQHVKGPYDRHMQSLHEPRYAKPESIVFLVRYSNHFFIPTRVALFAQ